MLLALLWSSLALAAPAPVQTTTWDGCAECHDSIAASFAENVHSRLRPFEAPHGRLGCAACHGDPAEHLKSGRTDDLVRFGAAPRESSSACLACHARSGLAGFAASAHADELGCADCHSVHERRPASDGCTGCHAEVRAAFEAPSHHPLPEGKMTCASCHDVHRPTEAALRTDERPNDLCLSCHSAQQGPFVFEHEPVVEDCRTCHEAHGAVADHLLTVNEPMLCLQCHEAHFHAGLEARDGDPITVGGRPYGNALGEQGWQLAFTTRCTQCHVRVHGSDLPAQGITSRGRALTR